MAIALGTSATLIGLPAVLVAVLTGVSAFETLLTTKAVGVRLAGPCVARAEAAPSTPPDAGTAAEITAANTAVPTTASIAGRRTARRRTAAIVTRCGGFPA